MPLYEYRCNGCGETSEFLQRFDDAPKTECPKCKGELEKLLSAPAFHLKGSGWYKTDYADTKKGSADSDSSAKSAGEDKPDKSANGGESKSDSSGGSGDSKKSKKSAAKGSEKGSTKSDK